MATPTTTYQAAASSSPTVLVRESGAPAKPQGAQQGWWHGRRGALGLAAAALLLLVLGYVQCSGSPQAAGAGAAHAAHFHQVAPHGKKAKFAMMPNLLVKRQDYELMQNIFGYYLFYFTVIQDGLTSDEDAQAAADQMLALFAEHATDDFENTMYENWSAEPEMVLPPDQLAGFALQSRDIIDWVERQTGPLMITSVSEDGQEVHASLTYTARITYTDGKQLFGMDPADMVFVKQDGQWLLQKLDDRPRSDYVVRPQPSPAPAPEA